MARTYTLDDDSRHAIEARPFAGREVTIRAYAKLAPGAKLSHLVCLRIGRDHARALIADLRAALATLDHVEASIGVGPSDVPAPHGCALCGQVECLGGSEAQGCSVPVGRVRGFGL